MASDTVRRSRPTPWFGILMGLLLLWFLSPLPDWVMSWLDDTAPVVIEPHLLKAGVRGSDPEMNADGIIASLETRRRLVIRNANDERIELNHDEDVDWFHFTKDGKGMLIRAGDTVRMWDTDAWMILDTWIADQLGRSETTVAADPRHVVTLLTVKDSTSTFTIRHLKGTEISDRVIQLPLKTLWRYQLNAAANCVVAVCPGRLVLIHVDDGGVIEDRECASGRNLCVSPDLRYVAWNNSHGQLWLTQDYVTLLDRQSGNQYQIRDRQLPIQIAHFTADSQRLVVRMGHSLALYRPSIDQIESVLAGSNNVQPVCSANPLAVYGISEHSATAMVWNLAPL